MADHDPVILFYRDVVTGYVLRCGCGLNETYSSRESAETGRREHLAEAEDGS